MIPLKVLIIVHQSWEYSFPKHQRNCAKSTDLYHTCKNEIFIIRASSAVFRNFSQYSLRGFTSQNLTQQEWVLHPLQTMSKTKTTSLRDLNVYKPERWHKLECGKILILSPGQNQVWLWSLVEKSTSLTKTQGWIKFKNKTWVRMKTSSDLD